MLMNESELAALVAMSREDLPSHATERQLRAALRMALIDRAECVSERDALRAELAARDARIRELECIAIDLGGQLQRDAKELHKWRNGHVLQAFQEDHEQELVSAYQQVAKLEAERAELECSLSIQSEPRCGADEEHAGLLRRIAELEGRAPESNEVAACDVDYGALDPGVRRLVRVLNEDGFVTTDSGDGATKGEDGEPYPHVHMVLPDYADMVQASHRLLNLVREAVTVEPADLAIQASYSPLDGLKTLSVFNVADRHLKETP